MTEENPARANVDLTVLHQVADRIVAANLTTAIYTRLDTLQSQPDYRESDFDDIARDVVREVMQTYSALLSVFQNPPDESSEPGNGR
jgi:hypothetical protein